MDPLRIDRICKLIRILWWNNPQYTFSELYKEIQCKDDIELEKMLNQKINGV